MSKEKPITIYERLSLIQKELKAPKSQVNAFGKYKYRSCEDILTAVKPLLGDCVLIMDDEIVNIGDRFYVKATATLQLSEAEKITAVAYAREQSVKKGMDEAQITGAVSSYSRKYSLNGLFAIDDTQDPDSKDNTQTITGKLEDLIIDFGKFKGKQLSAVDKDDLTQYCIYLTKQAESEGKKLNGKTKSFVDNARNYLKK